MHARGRRGCLYYLSINNRYIQGGKGINYTLVAVNGDMGVVSPDYARLEVDTPSPLILNPTGSELGKLAG